MEKASTMPLKYGNMKHSTVAREPFKMESLPPQDRAANKHQYKRKLSSLWMTGFKENRQKAGTNEQFRERCHTNVI